MPEAAVAPLGGGEVVDDRKARLYDRDEHQLGDSVASFDFESCQTSIPDRHEQLTLIVRVDETDQIAKDDAMFVTQPRARQDHGRKCWIGDMDCHARWYEFATTGFDNEVGVDQCAQIESGGAGRCIVRKREVAAESAIENLELYLFWFH